MRSAQYRRRIIDDELDDLMPHLPALALQGPRGVGKTSTARQRASSVVELDDPAQAELLQADPQRLARLAPPLLLDEWQRFPQVWDAVRREVDRLPTGGRFLLTGSAVPSVAPAHSGAGRIVSLRMRPLSLAERPGFQPSVSLRDLLRGGASIAGATTTGVPDYVDEMLRSGLPALHALTNRARTAALDAYLEALVHHDLVEQGLTVRRPGALRAWLTAYAAATSTSTSYQRLLDAATPGEHDKPSRATAAVYRDMLEQLWLLDPLPAWLPSGSHFSRLAMAPVHHLADPALAARLVGATSSSLLERADSHTPSWRPPGADTLLGALFESLVVMCTRVYAQANEATVWSLRTRNGDHEVDVIIRRADGGVVAFEVKLNPLVNDRDVRHLLWLRERLGPQLVDSAVITTGADAYRRRDGVAVIPASLLGP